MQKYKLRDVPKGKRLKHFIHYYWGHTLFVLFLGILLGYTAYLFLRPKADVQVMWMSGDYTVTCETALQRSLDNLDWDTNEDGHMRALLTYVDFDTSYADLDMTTKQEVMILVSGQGYSFFLAGQHAVDWMAENEILGTWAELGVTDERAEEYLLIPARELDVFSGEYLKPLEDVYLCITATPTDPERLEEYESQIAALRRLLTRNGLL